MGIGRSKFPISYDEACSRAGNDVVERLKDTYTRYSSNTGLLPQVTFLRDIFGDGMPPKLAEKLYESFHGTQKGIKFSDLLRGLVLLVHGTRNEKALFLTQMLTETDDHIITKEAIQKFIAAVDVDPSSEDLDTLFNTDRWCQPERFMEWIKEHPNLSSFTEWLLSDEQSMSLTAEADPPTYYQTLAKKYGPNLQENDVMNIEKTYWSLKGSSGKFDIDVLQKAISPPFPAEICGRLFEYFDVNLDGHIDLSEMVRGVALFCRKSYIEKIQVLFGMFDNNGDGLLDEAELKFMIKLLVRLYQDNLTEGRPLTVEDVLQESLDDSVLKNGMSYEQFSKWCEVNNNSSLGHNLIEVLLQVLVEVCHVKLGLRPQTVEQEEAIIRGYINRFDKTGRGKGQSVYLISAAWFNIWRIYTNFEMSSCPLSNIQVKYELYPANQFESGKNAVTHNSYPMAEPVSETVDVVDEGEEATEGFTHIVTSSNSRLFSLCSANSVSPPLTMTSAKEREMNEKDPRRPGAIDNSVLCMTEPFPGSKKLISLTNEGGILQNGLKEYDDYYVISEDIWRALVTWYGSASFSGGPSLPRQVIDDDGTLELYPIIFKVYKHTTLPPSKQAKSGPWNSILDALGFLGFRSNNDNPSGPLPNIPGDPSQPVLPRRVLYYSATFNKMTTVQEVCECLQKVLHAKPEDLRIYNISNEEKPDLLDEEEKTLEELGFDNGQKILVETRNKDNSWPEELIAVIKEVQSKDSEKESEKVKSQGSKVPEGATGLSNLGNTCFMNSSLQCVSNLPPLTTYFREKDHFLEINKQNPLGMKGVLAKRYGELIQDLWSGHNKSITPWRFRYTIAQNAPQFNNFQQQDAQELLAFVLDGLHEDLNRVKVKPYRELADSDDRPLAEVAEEAWSYHKERNDSIIVDLFQGQLKSMVECTVCSYKSTKFDPFTFLSLPLPLESKTNLEVVVVRLDGSQPIRYSLKQELDGKYKVLREEIQKLCGLSFLLLVDVFAGTIRSFPQDTQKIRTILSGSLYAFELPEDIYNARSESPTDIMRDKEDIPLEEATANEGTETVTVLNTDESRPLEEPRPEELLPLEESPESRPLEEPRPDDSRPLEESVPDVDNSTTEKAEEVEKINECVENELKEEKTSEDGVMTMVDFIQEGGGSESPPDTDELSNKHAKEHQSQVENTKSDQALSSPQHPPTHCSPRYHKFIFAVHRRTMRMENYFLSTQKNRPVVFSTPMIVPCEPSTAACDIYNVIWHQVLRLIIPDPPNSDNQEEFGKNNYYPFKLKMVRRDGLFCCRCQWFKFCRGCPIECNESPIGDDPHYLAIDWDDAFLHLRYLAALERPKDHESMEALKSVDTHPIDLTDCFAAFSRPEELGEDELWYCKKCKTHHTARKSLEVWKVPPVLIIHLKRFHFNNGRWTKSQRTVDFPMRDLDPLAYAGSVDNLMDGSVDNLMDSSVDDYTTSDKVEYSGRDSVTPPLLGNGEEATPLNVEAEVHEMEEETVTGNKEAEKSDHVTSTDDHGTSTDNHVTSIDDHVTSPDDHVTSNDDQVTSIDDHVTSTDDHVTSTDDQVKRNRLVSRTFSRTTSTHMSSHPIYDLFAITCHNGVLGGGHYTSFAKNPNGKWYYYNDSTCKETTEDRVSSESPYLLFYEVRGLSSNYGDYRAANKKQNTSPSPAEDVVEVNTVRTGASRGGPGGRGPCRQQ